MSMTDAELETRIQAAVRAKHSIEQAKMRPKYPFIDPLTIKRRCFMTGIVHEIIVERAGWDKYNEKDGIDAFLDCLPMLTEADQELIVSSLSVEGAAMLFGARADEDDAEENDRSEEAYD